MISPPPQKKSNVQYLMHTVFVVFLHLDFHRPVQTDHGLLSECLQRGHVSAAGASGLSGKGSVQVRAKRPQRLPELGERPGLTTHRFQSGPKLPQEKDN